MKLITYAAFILLAFTVVPAMANPLYNGAPKPAPAVQTQVTTPSPSFTTPAAPATANVPPSEVTLQMTRAIATACPGQWDSTGCLSAVSSSNLIMAANYAADLKEKGHPGDAEQVKEHCAASTAAREKSFPAYAMKSAFIECANLITDVAEKTNVKPDPTAFQLLLAPTLCLDNDPRCGTITDQLKRFASP